MRRASRVALILGVAAAGCRSRPVAALVEDPAPVFRGHQELVALAGEGAVPLVLGRGGSIGFCLDVPPGADTSQWEARLFGEAFVPPAVRLDTTLCFEAAVPASVGEGESRLCGELRDRYDGSTQALACLPFRFLEDDSALRGLEKRIATADLDELSREAGGAGFPALALRVRLIAAYKLRREGSEASRARAAELVRDAPAWIGEASARRWAGQLDYERATLALDASGDPAASWGYLRAAERSFRRCGERRWIAVVGKQAEVLSRAGALGEAAARLRFALDQCASAPCDPALVRASRNTLAWLVASDPDAGETELADAAASLSALLAGGEAPADPLEHANLFVNLALLRQRQGSDPGGELARARERIGAPASARARELAGWADLVEGRTAPDARLCERVAASDESDRLRAFGMSCAAAAYRRAGDLDRAADRYARALALHALSGAARLGQDVPLGPGQRAEDAYAAARVELERGRPERAWSILRALDDEEQAAPAAAPPEVATWLATLAELEKPSSPARRAQREAIRQGALDRMQEAMRTRREAFDRDAGDGGVAYRAFPLDDEVVVLRRLASGEIVPYRRTPVARRRLVGAVRAVREALDRGTLDDARWVEAAAPLADALAPDPADLGPLSTFALHGILQEIPIAAMPVGSRWLGALTTVAVHAAGGAAEDREATGAAVFVSDPHGNLGPVEAPPGTRVLRGGQATREALQAALAGAHVLHLDAHARYEPAFPELSTVLLAGGAVTGHELAAWGRDLTLANLSGCQTGRAPVTAGTGRFGLAGLLARSGVPWVIGARADLDDALAIEFNRAFYEALGRGAAVPAAYRGALEGVRERYPASRWGAIVLIRAGQTSAVRTPSLTGGVQ